MNKVISVEEDANKKHLERDLEIFKEMHKTGTVVTSVVDGETIGFILINHPVALPLLSHQLLELAKLEYGINQTEQ